MACNDNASSLPSRQFVEVQFRGSSPAMVAGNTCTYLWNVYYEVMYGSDSADEHRLVEMLMMVTSTLPQA